MVGYLRVGGVAFGLWGSGRAVFHDVELLFAEWLPAFLRSSSWSRNMRLSYVVAYPSWFQQVLCYCVSYLDGLCVCARFVV